MAKITLIVGINSLQTGYLPGHAAVQIEYNGNTTYAGLGPRVSRDMHGPAKYDIFTLPTGAPLPNSYFGSYADARGGSLRWLSFLYI